MNQDERVPANLNDDEAARDYGRQLAMDGLLEWVLANKTGAARVLSGGSKRRTRRHWVAWISTAAALVLGASGYVYWKRAAIPNPVARVEHLKGTAYRISGDVRELLRGDEGIRSGEGISTVGQGSRIDIVYPDRTRLSLDADTVVGSIEEGPAGKRVFVAKGIARADVAKQDAGRPMILTTPQGDAKVLGTTLRLHVDPNAGKETRLEVTEGKVELKSKLDGKSVVVVTGHFAVIAADVPLVARPMAPKLSGPVAAMAPNSWLAVPNTTLWSAVPDPVRYPKIQGRSGPAAVISGWSGAALDSRRQRLLVWGGGAVDYFGNELYAFDVAALRWERVTEPTPDPQVGSQVNADGTPAARSTFNGLAYIAHADRFFAMGGSLAEREGGGRSSDLTWTFDLQGRKWENRNPAPKGPLGGGGSNCSYDPATRKVWWGSALGTNGGLWDYDYDRNAWTRHNTDSFYYFTSLVDTKRGLLVVAGSGSLFSYDLRKGKPIRTPWKTTGGDALVASSNPGFDYDPIADRYVGWAGDAVYALDPDTKIWTVHHPPGAPKATGVKSGGPAMGTYGRWRYVSSVEAFILVTDINENVHFFKLKSGK